MKAENVSPINGAALTNLAVLSYNGAPQGIRATADFIYTARTTGGAGTPPTDISLACEVEPDCQSLVYENASGQVLGILSAVDTDQTEGHVFSVLDDIRFEVVAAKLKLVDGEFIDFETEPSVLVTVRAVDGSGNEFDKTLTITVKNVNETPTDLTINSNYVPPGKPGLSIGNLAVLDVDAGDQHTYMVVGDERFVVTDGILQLATDVSLGVGVNIPITIIATDLGGLMTRLVVAVSTNPADIVIPPTPSAIAFRAPDSGGAIVDVAPALCAPPSGYGIATSNARSLTGVGSDPIGVVSLDDADAYAIGEPVIISVSDVDQNFQPFVRETVEVTAQVDGGGDSEVVTLIESGVDTGLFVGYVYTTSQVSNVNDCILTVKSRDKIVAIYTDPTDGTDIKDTLALIAPVGVVFNDATGEPMNGVIVVLVDANTGAPAQVRGDGPAFSLFPSSVISGETIKDASGKVYTHGKGEYRFPSIPAGDYRIELFSARGWEISDLADSELQQLATSAARSLAPTSLAAYSLSIASRGQVFHVSQGSLPRVDVPIRLLARPATVVTPSVIDFLQYSANSKMGSLVGVEPSRCVNGSSPQLVELKGLPVPVPGQVNLVVTKTIKAGQPLFVRVKDNDQNADPLVREKIVVRLDVATSGDREFLELTETEVNSGEFVGYVQTAENESQTGSCMLGVVKNQPVKVTYTDAFDVTDTVDSLLLIDPFGKVFSTRDGRLIDGATVTLIDLSTGQPATVFGDGPAFADYPNSVVTGGTVTDAAGISYEFPMGEYRFPFVIAGQYRLEVTNLPAGFLSPSTATVEAIQALPGSPFEITEGSRGEQFEVPVGPALHIDLPVDEPFGTMFVAKTASKSIVAIGDFLQYRISVQNTAGNEVNNTQVLDRLPKGFRFQKNSLRIAGVKVADPMVDSDGRTLRIALPAVAAANLEIAYVVEVTAGAEKGPAINHASVIGDLVSSTNTATARVVVTDDLFRSKAILEGRVSLEQCAADVDGKSANGEQPPGMAGVRVFLEDGTYVITDDKGFWHIEGVNPGAHVVQLDMDSLEERYEVSPCNENSRFAGSAYSQFVDVKGGTLWRADFKVQEKAPPTSSVELTQTLKVDDDGLWVSIVAANKGPVAVANVNAIYNVPKGWLIVPGKATLDSALASFSDSIVGSLWDLGDLPANSKKELRFALAPQQQTKEPAIGKAADNLMAAMQARFSSRGAVLSERDKSELDALIKSWQGRRWDEITVVGHSDNVPVASRNRKEFANNEVLSLARARAVAEYIKGKVDAAGITAVGVADRYPLASNATADGRKQNRRVEFLLKSAAGPLTAARLVASAEILNGTSGVRLAFQSPGTKKGRTDVNSVPLNRIVGGFDVLSATVKAEAAGSWDLVVDKGVADVVARDPKAQGLISITDGSRLVNAINAVKLDMDSRLKPKLTVDGVEVGSDRIGFKMSDDTTGKTLYSYIGVNFGEPGSHKVELQGVDGFGIARFSETANVVRVGEVFTITMKKTDQVNIADGRTPVRVQLELRDKAGELINAQYKLRYESQSLRAFDKNLSLSDLAKITDGNYVSVSRDGIASFNPVSQSGEQRVTLSYNEAEADISVFVEPEKRDWIMVGIAEGTVAHRTLSGNMQGLREAGLGDELDADGRVAFYAKGQVKGEYVLTLAYDSDKAKQNALQQTIDPNNYYTLYGDNTSVQYDAASREKLYLKLEKDQFYALFGDFSTGLAGGELSNYSRALTGVKTEYKGDVFEFTGYASEANQAFVKDEIRGDGTSGIYRLKASELVINSEKIRIETRDRFHSEIIINTKEMSRHVDYNIDYDAGTLFFKEPIYSQDTGFNPVFIVADYELAGSGANKLNVGGRLAYKPVEDAEVGLTVIKEGVEGRESSLVGTDLEYKINDSMEVRAEVAATQSTVDGVETKGTAYLAEITRRTAELDARGYIREQESGFGLGQQSESETGTRKMGVEGTYAITEEVDLKGEVYRETGLASGNNQDVASTTMQYQGEDYSLNGGLRSAASDANGESQVSNQLLVGGTYRVLDGKATLSANADTPLSGKGEAANFPKRLRVGLDYKLTEKITLKAEQEFSWGEAGKTQGSRVGLSSALWEGAELATNITAKDEEDAQRLAAVAGLKQRWDMNDNWSFDFGVDRSQTISEKRAPPALQVTTVYASPENNDFTSVTVGSKFRQDAWDWSTRVEYRASDTEDKMNFITDVIHDLDDGQQLLAKLDIQKSDGQDTATMISGVQLGYAYRPEDSAWTVFNRLDLTSSTSASAGLNLRTNKIVNNMNANYLWGDDTQIAFQYGFKYVVDNIETVEYKGFTDLYGLEVRHDMGDKWDVGFQGGRYNTWNSGVADYTYGVSVGYSMARNVWLSLGYNFDGFQDDDFGSSEYTAEGVFLKYRFKFDQYSAGDMFSRFGQ